MSSKQAIDEEVQCKLMPVLDTMDLLSGKWRIIILTALFVGGKQRFNQLKGNIPKITGRALSIDLKYLEENKVVERTVRNTSPITVEYALTAYGLTLGNVFEALTEWGKAHRKKMIQ